MKIEDVVLVAAVREDIRNNSLRVDAAMIPRRIEAAQAGRPSSCEGVDVPPNCGATEQEACSTMSTAPNPDAVGPVAAEVIISTPQEQAIGGVDDIDESNCEQLVSSVTA
jgi:hypothetical protein